MRLSHKNWEKRVNFWRAHGFFFLICITFFSRLTMLFAISTPFGILAWLGWLFLPHLTVAILATQRYWPTNNILCIIAWAVACLEAWREISIAFCT